MLVSEVLTKIRGRLMEEDPAAYRYSDAKLLIYLNNAQRFALTVRGDLKLNSLGELSTIYAMTLSTMVNGVETPTPLLPSLEPYDDALADYTCYKVLLEESDDNLKDATKFYVSAMQALGVKPDAIH